ncbi:MAG: helix-turn-helix domain-containing protein [Bdellovibrionales bacterium]|nr:helix-turn-helix domain-containing protein [Bdellovibrionales bacterium]
MHLNDEPLSLYDILELTPDATPQEIRSAYLRLKSAYGKDNIAHYSVFSRDETEQMLQNVENAYMVLSNPEKRRSYDENQGFRAPNTTQSLDLFGSPTPSAMSSAQLAGMTSVSITTSPTASGREFQDPFTITPSPIATPTPSSTIQNLQNSLDSVMNDIDHVIRTEQMWSGPAIRRIREAKRISLEDLSDYTRISRSYLHALEEENYGKLPAVVYVRGFLQQVSRRLKLPHDLVSRQYLDRMRMAAPEKT